MVMIRLDELRHHGIKGMKWGIRRYQNEDGSLTPEGEKRYEKSLSKVYDGLDDRADYVLPAGTTVSRRSSADKDGVFSNKKVTYTYDEDSADEGYGGMRDYHDYGSAAGVNTPTVIFNPEDRLRRRRERIDD